MGLFIRLFFNLGERQINVLPGVYLQNAEYSVCEDYLFWAFSKLSETGSRVWAFVKSNFAQVVFSKCKDI